MSCLARDSIQVQTIRIRGVLLPPVYKDLFNGESKMEPEKKSGTKKITWSKTHTSIDAYFQSGTKHLQTSSNHVQTPAGFHVSYQVRLWFCPSPPKSPPNPLGIAEMAMKRSTFFQSFSRTVFILVSLLSYVELECTLFLLVRLFSCCRRLCLDHQPCDSSLITSCR